MILQIFWPTYYGNAIKLASGETVGAIYDTNWNEVDSIHRKNLIILMEMTRKPIFLTAGYIFEISLENFLLIMKSAYTLITVFNPMSSVQV
jgi:hypothetical protein